MRYENLLCPRLIKIERIEVYLLAPLLSKVSHLKRWECGLIFKLDSHWQRLCVYVCTIRTTEFGYHPQCLKIHGVPVLLAALTCYKYRLGGIDIEFPQILPWISFSSVDNYPWLIFLVQHVMDTRFHVLRFFRTLHKDIRVTKLLAFTDLFHQRRNQIIHSNYYHMTA